MRRMVFWKVLLGFWATALLMSLGVWLMFALLRPVPQTDTVSLGDIAATAAKSIIEQDGEQAFEQQRKSWPGFLRGQVRVVPGNVQGASVVAKDPGGQSYSLVAGDRQRRDRGVRRPFDIPPEVLLASLVGGLIFSAILAWYLTSPVQRIRAGFDQLAGGDFSVRLAPSIGRRRDEIADLARAFDIMAKRLEELVSARDRLLAGVSHELRSPLARLQLSIGLARQDPAKVGASLERISREAQRLDEMVGEILTLSKLESGVKHAEDYFDFAEVVRLLTEDAKFEAAPLGVAVEHRIVAPGPGENDWIALGSGRLVSHAVENIVRNALRFSKKGQTVSVILDRDTHGQFRLTVTDEGPGVSEALLDSLFKPFVQGSDNQGYGLGLAIAERAIIAHGGTISAHNRTTGGLCVVVSLPPAALESVAVLETH